jgi:ABC-type uncharacterized transport system involved in gliding motility auxiliary subunit
MNAAVSALVGVLCLLVAWCLFLVLPGARLFSWSILAFGLLLLAVAAAAEFRAVRRTLGSRRGRARMRATVRLSLFAGIVVFVNALSVDLHHRFDATGSGQFTLTPETQGVAQALDQPVEAVTIFPRDLPVSVKSYVRSLLAEYRRHTERLTVKDVDPDVSPDQARRYGVGEAEALAGAVIFVAGDRRIAVVGNQLAEAAEQAFTSAILQVTGVRQKTVYFLTGHGEGDIEAGYGAAASALRDGLFVVRRLNLSGLAAVPDDAAVLVIAGPQASLADHERRAIEAYVGRGGRLLMLLNPDPPPQFAQMLSAWGLDVGTGVVVDPASHAVPDRSGLLVPGDRNAFQLPKLHFPGAAAILPRMDIPEGIGAAALVWTSPEGRLDAAGDPGTLPIGVLLSAPSGSEAAPEGLALAVIGDADFAADGSFADGNNGDLFVAAVRWLAAGTDIVSINRKVLPNRRFLLSPEQARFLNVSSMALLPILVLAVGGLVWWGRRAG